MDLSSASGWMSGAPVPAAELAGRLERLLGRLDANVPDWRAVLVAGKTNLYYLTGSRPSGMLVLQRGGESTLWVRRGLERAMAESAFPDIRPMRAFADLAAAWPNRPASVLIEKELLPLGFVERLNKHLGFAEFAALDPHLAAVRAVKSAWELAIMQAAGRRHRVLLEETTPALMREGMSEAELAADIFHAMLRAGHHAVTRLNMFDTELFMGAVCFGENGLCPNAFEGPDGIAGLCPAVPLFGSHERRLRRGDLVFLDVGFGIAGYHTDKSMVYSFGAKPSAAALAAHNRCLDICKKAAAMLRPGMVPARIYAEIVGGLEPEFARDFMGYGSQQVRFLGHGIGLHIDEFPVIAGGFEAPLGENMTIALEPKKGLAGIGLVGVEDTFVTTPDGGRSITGGGLEILTV